MISNENDEIKFSRISRSYREGDYSILNFHYLIGTMENGVHHYEEDHRLRLTSKEEMLDAFKQANFDITFEDKGLVGRGMYYGIKKN
jgi:hypothetical protein